MYTSNAYFPSPIDGNYYQTYVYLQNGQLVEVHFYNGPNGLELVYFLDNGWGQAMTPTSVDVYIRNHCSNIIYFQPSVYGQVQQLYCTTGFNLHLTLLLNSDFQRFEPIQIFDSNIIERNNATTSSSLPMSAFIEGNPSRVPVNVGNGLPLEIIKALQAVQSGALSNTSISCTQHGFHLTAEDQNGNRYILEKFSMDGINHTNETTIDTAGDRLKRQSQVKLLRAKKMTQIQIANHLGVSQKTISNDLKELGLS